jgi:hypothetical protein
VSSVSFWGCSEKESLTGVDIHSHSQSCEVSLPSQLQLDRRRRLGIDTHAARRYSTRAMLDEQNRLYGGIYSGKTTDQAAKLEVETADMCLIVGRMDSDLK